MRWILGWMVVLALGCAARMPAGGESSEARLEEGREAYTRSIALYDEGRYTEALTLAERALALEEPVLGDMHPEVAHCLHLLGELHRLQGDFDRAEKRLERALVIRETVVDHDTLGSVTAVRLLAFTSSPEMESDRQAGAFFGHGHALGRRSSLYGPERRPGHALASRKPGLNANQSALSDSLNSLANLYQERGLYSRAEPLYVRALTLRETVLGKDHPEVADSLNNLALLHREQGLYARAEPLYVRALALREAELGKKHPDLAASLNSLANLYQEQGVYDRAEPLYVRAIALQEAASDGNPADLAASLNNLGSLYLARGLHRRAEPLYVRALALWEKTLGKRHPHVAALLNNLATLYRDLGQYARAEPLYERALVLWEESLGKNHPDVAGLLSNLATLHREQGRYARAEPLYERALAIREAVLGKDHPGLAASLNNLAFLRLAQHRLDAAVPLLTRAFAVSEQRLRREALDFSEARLASFLQLLRADEERLYALVRAHPDSADVRRLVLSAALLLKGRSVEETANISRAVYRSLGAEERGTFEQLRSLRTQLASLSLQGPGLLPLRAYQQRLQALAEQGDALEATLARRSAPLRALAALPSPADIVDRVAGSLPADGALVEFITYEERPLVPGRGAPGPQRQLRCLALVLLPDASIRALDLGPAGPIEVAASRLRDALARRDVGFESESAALYQLAFRPLLPLLGDARRVVLSPDGQLSLVPFAALHDGQRFLVDTHDFTYLTSGKDLLPRPQRSTPATSVVVLADPAFDAVPPERSGTTGLEGQALRDWNLVPLPGSREEAEAIQRLLPQAQLFLGPDATRERLLRLPTPGILHLATHGFFLEDAVAPERSRALAKFGALGEGPLAQPPPDPLLRSGLLFAGANTQKRRAAGSASSGSALVTALELAGLDLWGTQLVVLSACDTGRGDVRRGQGIYGLRRAFIVAGAETVVMSLWKVDDTATRVLMETYYRHLLAGLGPATALREAMREVRTEHPHPHYWAPFIAMGRDAPLLRPVAPSP